MFNCIIKDKVIKALALLINLLPELQLKIAIANYCYYVYKIWISRLFQNGPLLDVNNAVSYKFQWILDFYDSICTILDYSTLDY